MARFIHLVVFNAEMEGYGFPEAAFFDEVKADQLAHKMNRGRMRDPSKFEVLSVEIKDDGEKT